MLGHRQGDNVMEIHNHGRDRRAGQEERLREMIDDVVRENISLRSLRKNGGSWGQWIERNITLDRIIIFVIFIFTVGGRVQQVGVDLAETQRRTNLIEGQHIIINNRLGDIEARQKMETDARIQQEEMLKKTADLVETVVRQNNEINSRLTVQPTRGELNKAIDNINRRISRISQ